MGEKTVTDDYIITITAKLVGDENFRVMQNRISQLERENRNLGTSASRASRGMRDMSTASNNAAAGLGRNASLMQNLSYQFTDFAVQTSGGVDALRAFSQQAPQVAGALGAAGIGGAAGVATFAILSLVAALTPAIKAMFGMEDAVKKAMDEIERLDASTLSLDDFIKDAEKSAEELYELTEQGKEFAATIKLVNETVERNKIDQYLLAIESLSKSSKQYTETVNQVRESILRQVPDIPQEQLDKLLGQSKFIREATKDVAESFGISADFVYLFANSLEQLSKGGDAGSEAANRILRLFAKVGTVTEDSKENVENLSAALQGLLGANYFGELGSTIDDSVLSVEKAGQAWKKYTDELRTPKEILDENVKAVLETGLAAGASVIEISKVIDLLYKEYGESEFERLAKEAKTLQGGINAAQIALKELVVSEEYLAGIREELAKTDLGSKEYQRLVKLLGDAATPIETINAELGKIVDKREGMEELTEAFKKFKESYTGNPKDLEALEKALTDSGKKIKTMWEEIGEAIGGELESAVGSFVDAMFDADASFGDVIDSMLQNITKLILQITIMRTLMNGLQGTAVGDFLFPQTKSAVVASPIPDASNVVQLSRTPFARTAQAYSTGPITSSTSGGASVRGGTTINVINNSNAEIETNEATDSRGGTTIDMMISNAVDSAISKGRFDKTFNNLYGLRRRGV